MAESGRAVEAKPPRQYQQDTVYEDDFGGEYVDVREPDRRYQNQLEMQRYWSDLCQVGGLVLHHRFNFLAISGHAAHAS